MHGQKKKICWRCKGGESNKNAKAPTLTPKKMGKRSVYWQRLGPGESGGSRWKDSGFRGGILQRCIGGAFRSCSGDRGLERKKNGGTDCTRKGPREVGGGRIFTEREGAVISERLKIENNLGRTLRKGYGLPKAKRAAGKNPPTKAVEFNHSRKRNTERVKV